MQNEPNVWIRTTVGEFINANGGEIKTGPFGTKLKASEYTDSGVPVISVGEVGFGELRLHERTPTVDRTVTDRMPEYILEEGDIVFGRKGAVERSARVRREQAGWFLGSDGIRLRLPTTCDRQFVAYQFLTHGHRNWIKQHALGTTMPSLNQKIISRIPIAIPPLPEQRAIAHILGTLDAKIQLNRRMNETLESMARAIFKSWFVDFDPVRAKMDGRQPTGMDADTASLFPDSLVRVDGELIPTHWERITTERTLSDDRGISVGVMYPGDHDPSGVPLIKAGDLSGGTINRKPQFRVSPRKHEEYRRTEFSGGEILMTLVGNIGQCAVVPPEMKGWNSARAVAVIRLSDPSSADYVRLSFQSAPIQFLMHAWANTTVQPTLNLKEIRKLPLLWPPQRVREAFAETVSPLFEHVDANKRESETLASLRDTLLPKLLSGELRAGDAAKQFADITSTVARGLV